MMPLYLLDNLIVFLTPLCVHPPLTYKHSIHLLLLKGQFQIAVAAFESPEATCAPNHGGRLQQCSSRLVDSKNEEHNTLWLIKSSFALGSEALAAWKELVVIAEAVLASSLVAKVVLFLRYQM
jgi:hypothetical protein